MEEVFEQFEYLVPKFTDRELNEIKLYYETNKKHKTELETTLLQELTTHPVWGELLKSIPEDVRRKNSDVSDEFQKKAIYEGEWLSFIEYQISQGTMYAQMGYEFNQWYELINIIRNAFIPFLTRDFKDDNRGLTACLNGMNRFFDVSMSIMGEAYINEKRKIIESQMKIQTKMNKELESFAYIISHDLKTPLRGISSLSEWIIDDYGDKLDETGKEYLGLLKNRVKRMEELIDGVLSYSRIGRVDIEASLFNLDEVIEECVATVDNEKQVIVEYANPLPKLETSKTLINQLFMNLIDNAVKYNDKDKVRLMVGSKKEKSGYSFYVRDNGPGIPTEYHDKVFQIFQTLATKDEHDSTGIGLTIVKKIVDTYGGEIQITNYESDGVKFSFSLPDLKHI